MSRCKRNNDEIAKENFLSCWDFETIAKKKTLFPQKKKVTTKSTQTVNVNSEYVSSNYTDDEKYGKNTSNDALDFLRVINPYPPAPPATLDFINAIKLMFVSFVKAVNFYFNVVILPVPISFSVR